MKLSGWFFDVYPVRDGVIVWLLDVHGEAHHFFEPFHPAFYLHLDTPNENALHALVKSLKLPVTVSNEVKVELFSGEEWNVTKITVKDPLRITYCVKGLQQYLPHFVFYNSNIPVAQMYLYDRQVFPLAKCEFDIADNILQHITLNDRFDAVNYEIPDLRILHLRNCNNDFTAKFSRTLQLEISYEERSYCIEESDPVSVIETLNRHLQHFDPDVIISSFGDATLLPTLVAVAEKFKLPLHLNRVQTEGYFTTKEKSIWTYGQVIHKDAAFMLAGRWHLDGQNSFIMEESDIDGVIELARLTQIPMQKQSRSAIGTGLASMQMSYAYRNNILIPAEKKEGEDFKSADELLLSDRGGLIFMPEMGYHTDIAELDFASMYPSLMEIHNISPETINCHCCNNNKVPELGYSICEKRRGIVPTTLKPVLEKRAYYKARRKLAVTEKEYQKYDRMQNALKWMLVTCFGYLGYRNARFGRIEAHEAVNAFSREALLTAKEVAEGNGYHLLHAIIDCLWLKKEGATEEDYLALCKRIEEVVGVKMSYEGMYNWLLFPSSKTDPGIPTSGKYVGWYRNGEMKMRGIEARRKDTPLFIKHAQLRMLNILADAKNIDEVKQRIPAILAETTDALKELQGGNVHPSELVLRRRVQKEAGEYANNNLSAVVVKELLEFGITIKAGELIEYIIIDSTGKRQPLKAKSLLTYQLNDGYDIDKYSVLLLKAVETLLSPFGYDKERLKNMLDVGKAKRKPNPVPAKTVQGVMEYC